MPPAASPRRREDHGVGHHLHGPRGDSPFGGDRRRRRQTDEGPTVTDRAERRDEQHRRVQHRVELVGQLGGQVGAGAGDELRVGGPGECRDQPAAAPRQCEGMPADRARATCDQQGTPAAGPSNSTAWCAVSDVSGSDAASTRSSLSGTRATASAGRTVCSACVPTVGLRAKR